MAVEGCCSCIKYSLFLFNFVFFLGGLASAGAGIYSLVHTHGDYAVVIDNANGTYGGFLVTVGVLSCILSAAGCLGALKEHRCALIFYGIVLSIIFLLELSAAGVGVAYRKDLKSIVDKGMLKTLDKYDSSANGNLEKSWNKVQINLKCCGVDSNTDWQRNQSKWGKDHLGVPIFPASCCTHPVSGMCTPVAQGLRTDGCLSSVLDTLKHRWAVLVGIAAGIAVVQILGISCACGLQSHIKRNDYRLV
ncbi:leukocyte surface antigen CD53-like [Sycon ciliatum]|uniref:leukocyte surface antigen CD53-like n=1 Tax=Sycon ciliatum TaxID=27933 RepID=UPI0020A956CA|eukprot:scpid8042/ scgid6571/ Tetraspanin-1